MHNPKGIFDYIKRKYGFNKQDLKSRSKRKDIAEARLIAMFLFKERFDFSYSKIGEIFNRDLSTAHSAFMKVTSLIKLGKLSFEGIDISKIDYQKTVKAVSGSLNNDLKIFRRRFEKALEEDLFGMMTDVNAVIERRLAQSIDNE